MSYITKKKRPMYGARPQRMGHAMINPSAHGKFREDFDQGIDSAIGKAKDLQGQGWEVDVNRTFMSDQAEGIKTKYENEGLEVHLVPVAKWGGQDVVMIAIREKPKPKSPTAATTATTSTMLTPEVIEKAYLSEYFSPGETPDQVDNGYTMDPDGVSAFIRRDASPSSQEAAAIVTNGKDTTSQPWLTIGEPGEKAILGAFQEQVNGVTKYTSMRFEQPGSQAQSAVKLDVLFKATRALKGGRPDLLIRVSAKGPDEPVFLANPEGDMVVIAPTIKDDPTWVDPEQVSFTDACNTYAKPK